MAFGVLLCLPCLAIAQIPNAPSIYQEPTENRNSGGCFLKDGSYILFGSNYNSPPTMVKMDPEGNVIRKKKWAGQFQTMEYDSAFNKIYLVSLSNPTLNIIKFAYMQGQFGQKAKLQILCMDTAMNPIWSKYFTVPFDSIGALNAITPDGAGGIYILARFFGKVSQAVNSVNGNFNRYYRIRGGYNYLTRIGKNGEQKWAKVQDDNYFSRLRYTGFTFLTPQRNSSIDVISAFADTLGAQFNPGNATIPTSYTLSHCRFDSSGTLTLQKKGFSVPGYFPFEQASSYRFTPVKVNEQKRFVLLSDKLYPAITYNTAILQFDTNFNFLSAYQLPFQVGYGGGLISIEENKVMVYGRGYGGRHIACFNLATGNLVFWRSQPMMDCYSALNFFSPTLSMSRNQEGNSRIRVHFENGPPPVGINVNASRIALVDLSTEGDFPCEPFHLPTLPSQYNPPADNGITWSGGNDFPWRPVSPRAFPDTALVFTPLYDTIVPFDLCKSINQPILAKDTTLCLDSLVLNNIPLNLRQQATINGALVSDSQFVVRSSGKYILTLKDTCYLRPVITDTIEVKFDRPQKPEITPDTLTLCPEETKQILVQASTNDQFKWSPTAGLSNDQIAQPMVMASQIPIGYSRFELSTSTQAGCIAKDTLIVFHSSKPLVTLNHSQPDTLLFLVGTNYQNLIWNVNGGSTNVGLNPAQLQVGWGPWFEGQSATVAFTDSFGCKSTLLYKREREKSPVFTIPNLVTANQDERNDVLEVQGLENSDRISVKIYNRWGKLVFEADDYKQNFPPAGFPPGTYFAWYRILYSRNAEAGTYETTQWIELVSKE